MFLDHSDDDDGIGLRLSECIRHIVELESVESFEGSVCGSYGRSSFVGLPPANLFGFLSLSEIVRGGDKPHA